MGVVWVIEIVVQLEQPPQIFELLYIVVGKNLKQRLGEIPFDDFIFGANLAQTQLGFHKSLGTRVKVRIFGDVEVDNRAKGYFANL